MYEVVHFSIRSDFYLSFIFFLLYVSVLYNFYALQCIPSLEK